MTEEIMPAGCPNSECFIIPVLSKPDYHDTVRLRKDCDLCIARTKNYADIDKKINETYILQAEVRTDY